MFKFVVVTYPETAPGFRLAGVEVLEAATLEEAKSIIPPLLFKDDTGIGGERGFYGLIGHLAHGKNRKDTQTRKKNNHSDTFENTTDRSHRLHRTDAAQGDRV